MLRTRSNQMINGYASQMSSSNDEVGEYNGALISLKKSKDNDEWTPNGYKTKKKSEAAVAASVAQAILS